MRRFPAPTLLLGVLYLCFFIYLAYSTPQLPARVATHFDVSGQPNGWMSRSAHLTTMAVFGTVFPLFVVGLCFVSRYLPDQWQNLPHREYWLAPGRREKTFAYIFRQSLWFACLGVGFAAGIQFSIVQANRQLAPQLSSLLMLGIGGSFVAGTLGWAIHLLRHFRRAA